MTNTIGVPNYGGEKDKNISLETFFSPKSIVVFGATDAPDANGQKKLGEHMTRNILESFKGNVYFINPSRTIAFGRQVYKTVKELPEVPDLAVVVTPAKTAPAITEECALAGVPSVIILAAGFGESGTAEEKAEGKRLFEEVKRIAKGRTRVCGPNCFGVVGAEMNSTFSRGIPTKGDIGVISQSGGLLAGFLNMDPESGMGISRAVSMGSMVDVSWAEWLRVFGNDPKTRSIVLYMEEMGHGENDARDFIAAAREISKTKLIIALKAGRTEESAKAAASHTGALAGDDALYEEVFRLSGILRAEDTGDVERILKLAKQPIPKGERLAMITNGGGPVVIATDSLILAGGSLAELSPDAKETLDKALPRTWSGRNPIDVIGDATPERYRASIEAALADPGTDGVQVTYVPVAVASPADIARVIADGSKKYPNKTVFASYTGAESAKEAASILRSAGVPLFSTTESAARTFGRISHWHTHRFTQGSPVQENTQGSPVQKEADELLRSIRESGRTILTEHEAKRIFRAYDIPANETSVATNENEAVAAAEKYGYPVVLKLHSLTLTHKTDVGGVILNLRNADEVRAAFLKIQTAVPPADFGGTSVQKMVETKGEEILIGAKTDTSFGHVIAFGQGGTRAEFYKDVALTLPPLDTASARALIARTKISKILEKGWRGSQPADMVALEKVLVAFSRFLETHLEVKEVDINPLIISESQMIALDARIILHEKDAKIPNPALS